MLFHNFQEKDWPISSLPELIFLNVLLLFYNSIFALNFCSDAFTRIKKIYKFLS